MTRKKMVLAAILIVAIVVRVYGAIVFPFEQDEIYTIEESTRLFNTQLMPGIQARPLFYIIEHPLVTNLPQTAEILRVLPLIFGLAGVWVTWLLARRVLGESAALFSTLVVALSPWHIHASAFTRYYSLVYLLAALVYLLLPRAYDSDRPWHYVLALIPLLLGTWTHPSFVFPIGGAILAIYVTRPAGAAGLFRDQEPARIESETGLSWRWPSKNAWVYLWGPFLFLSALIWFLIRFFFGSAGVDNGGDRGMLATLRLVPAMIDWMTPIIFGAGALGALLMIGAKDAARRRFGIMAVSGVLSMLIALFGLSFITAIYADYGVAALPLVFIAVGGLLQWLLDGIVQTKRTAVVWVIGALTLIGIAPSVISYMSDGLRFDYRPAFERITREAPERAVLTWPIAIFHEYAPHLRGYELPTDIRKLDSLMTLERDLWAVVSVKRYGIVFDDNKEISGWLSGNCRIIDHYQKPRFDYRLYRVELWSCLSSS